MIKMMSFKRLIPALIFIAGVITTIFFERVTDFVFPKKNDKVELAKDTLFVIPVANERTIIKEVGDDSLITGRKNDVEYWKNKALENSSNNNELIRKEIKELKEEISKYSIIPITGTEFISDKGYNEIITNPQKYFKNKKGYSQTSMTNYIDGNCPDFKQSESYVNLDFLMKSKKVFEETAMVFISMTGINEKGQHYYIYDEYYEPQFGYNHFKIKNVNSGKYVFTFGLILKTDLDKEYPEVHGFRCHFKK